MSAHTPGPDPLLSLRHQADVVEENGQPSMAGKIRQTIDLAEVRLNEMRSAAAKAEARERFAMEIFRDLQDFLEGIRLPSSLETRIVAFLSGYARTNAPSSRCGECVNGGVFVGAAYVGPCPKCAGTGAKTKAIRVAKARGE